MLRKILGIIKREELIKAGELVVAGVSGGADSICLLSVLLELKEQLKIQVAAVHVHHGIRGTEADGDERFVRSFCEKRNVPLLVYRRDVPRLAKEQGISEEEAGRRARYECFKKALLEYSGDKVAVAHNQNDNAETVLFHLFRGSGLKGLSGIAPVRGNIIRPILCLERREVEAYLKSVSAGKAGEEAPCREIAGEAEKQTDRIWSGEGEFVPRKELFRVDTAYFQEIPPILQKRVILELLKTLSPTGKDISAVHVMDTLELLKREGNRSISLPFGIRAWRQYGNVFLEQGRKVSVLEETMAQKDLPAETRGTAVLGGIEAPTGGGDRVRAPGVVLLGPEIFRTSFVYDLGHRGKIEFAGFYMKKGEEVPLKRYTKWFDCDKIKQCVEIRTRRQGDYLTIADKRGNTVHKSLKDYMITEKIPREIRDEIPVIAVGSHVLWLAGWRISQAFKVDDNTKRILQVRLLGTKFGGSSETEEKDGGKH